MHRSFCRVRAPGTKRGRGKGARQCFRVHHEGLGRPVDLGAEPLLHYCFSHSSPLAAITTFRVVYVRSRVLLLISPPSPPPSFFHECVSLSVRLKRNVLFPFLPFRSQILPSFCVSFIVPPLSSAPDVHGARIPDCPTRSVTM